MSDLKLFWISGDFRDGYNRTIYEGMVIRMEVKVSGDFKLNLTEEQRRRVDIRMAVALIEQLRKDKLITHEEMENIRKDAKKMLDNNISL